MRVRVRLIALDPHGAAPDGLGGSRDLDLPDGATLADGLRALGLEGAGMMVMVNDGPVPPESRADHGLADGDGITVFPPIQGG
ncbi:MAG: MoaD/ThiS family protein [Rhodobacterales bacterium]|nr:MoaD/ThiS family protein [Rhodobacterales bacterium]